MFLGLQDATSTSVRTKIILTSLTSDEVLYATSLSGQYAKFLSIIFTKVALRQIILCIHRIHVTLCMSTFFPMKKLFCQEYFRYTHTKHAANDFLDKLYLQSQNSVQINVKICVQMLVHRLISHIFMLLKCIILQFPI